MSDHHEPKYEHSHHAPTPISTLTGVFAILTFLMVATIVVALNPTPNTWVNNFIAVGIATVKATFVVLFFMGVKYTTKLGKLYAILGFLWVPLLLMTFCDYLTRHYEPVNGWTEEKKGWLTQGNLPKVKPHSAEKETHGSTSTKETADTQAH